MNSLCLGFIIGFIIYSINLCSIDNTIYRINSENNVDFCPQILFTEGIIGPLRTMWLAITHGYYSALPKIYFSINNPWFVIPLTMLITWLIFK